MKLTKETLKRIIKEELEAVLDESALLRKFNKDKKDKLRQYIRDMGKNPDEVQAALGPDSFEVMGQSLIDNYPRTIPLPKDAKINYHDRGATGRMFLEEMGADFIFSVLDDVRVLRMTDFDSGTIDVVGYYDPGNMQQSIFVRLLIIPQTISDPDTYETLEYELDKEFAIQIESSEDYYDPNSESQEELRVRLEIQLHEMYGN